ncbi:DUF669 domain-containing protein [Ochrobactrum sp. A-1]|uniref:DUF669 domain-containing protein n=1 Tax=Ochrobactrum sp. A-1 TaxID=2920940 RepID=UPI001F0A53A5|nr:DUF669 domain-containing protein [Ochrobactrum sp. A-1]
MVDIAGSYDQNAEASSFDPIPAGEYRAKIIEGDIQPISSRDDKGKCLVLTWQIETGPHDGRLIWQRLNLYGKNMNNLDKVINIANSQFAEIRQATGKLTPSNTQELEHIPCTIRVAVVTDPSGQYEPKNEIKRVSAVGGASAQNNAPQNSASNGNQQQAQRQQASSGGSSAPWK